MVLNVVFVLVVRSIFEFHPWRITNALYRLETSS